MAFSRDCAAAAVVVNRELQSMVGGVGAQPSAMGFLYISRQFIDHLFTQLYWVCAVLYNESSCRSHGSVGILILEGWERMLAL